jgi:hypothetical protein
MGVGPPILERPFRHVRYGATGGDFKADIYMDGHNALRFFIFLRLFLRRFSFQQRFQCFISLERVERNRFCFIWHINLALVCSTPVVYRLLVRLI